MQFGVPMVLLMYLLLFLLLSLLYPPKELILSGMADFIESQKKGLGGWTTAEKNTLFVFGTAVLLWIPPRPIW
ncbi:MAG: anion permease [Nitrospirae bacterium]|nr:anion permease [Candidatus Troglogloeales bacterium]